MSQVDYLHFFNNVIWNFGQFILMYFFICTVYIQNFYKVLRSRILNYTGANSVFKLENYSFDEDLSWFKNFLNLFLNLFKLNKCFYG